MVVNKYCFVLFFIMMAPIAVVGQDLATKEKVVTTRNNISDTIRPEYVLNVKLKKVPNSKKVVITSIKYEKRQTPIFKLLLAQKEKIKTLEKKNNTYQQ